MYMSKSMKRVALGEHFLAINPMFAAMSSVISETVFRSLSGIFDNNSYDNHWFSNHSYYGSFLSFCCFVGQNSIEFSIGRAVSSIDKRLPKFWKDKPIFCVCFDSILKSLKILVLIL
jgi:hypothetical protein